MKVFCIETFITKMQRLAKDIMEEWKAFLHPIYT